MPSRLRHPALGATVTDTAKPSKWTPARREACANGLGVERSLVAATARANRSKSGQDSAEWLPPADEAHCQYVTDWVGTELRWKLTADPAEIAALNTLADGRGCAAWSTSPSLKNAGLEL
ncbi:hypothetical protein [Streptomyces sp. NPDC050264]|uniref:hypothetical protein n=1 Tax=Streptomyces sp. NPDC050264 TaxID=3155038 RepID=UPI00343F2786